MKAPDKLFLHPNYKGEVGANWLTFPLTEKDECYIRKDALLEWAKKEMGEWSSESNTALSKKEARVGTSRSKTNSWLGSLSS